jgi:hypothetical protein
MRDVAQNKAPELYNTQICSSRARFACLTAVCMKIENSGTRRRVECTVTDVYQNLPASIFTKSWTALPAHMKTTSSGTSVIIQKSTRHHARKHSSLLQICSSLLPATELLQDNDVLTPKHLAWQTEAKYGFSTLK